MAGVPSMQLSRDDQIKYLSMRKTATSDKPPMTKKDMINTFMHSKFSARLDPNQTALDFWRQDICTGNDKGALQLFKYLMDPETPAMSSMNEEDSEPYALQLIMGDVGRLTPFVDGTSSFQSYISSFKQTNGTSCSPSDTVNRKRTQRKGMVTPTPKKRGRGDDVDEGSDNEEETQQPVNFKSSWKRAKLLEYVEPSFGDGALMRRIEKSEKSSRELMDAVGTLARRIGEIERNYREIDIRFGGLETAVAGIEGATNAMDCGMDLMQRNIEILHKMFNANGTKK